MITAWHQFIAQHAGTRALLCWLVVGVLCVVGFEWRGRKLKHETPDSLKLGSTADLVHEALDRLGTSGRSLYVRTQLSLDLIFPVAYVSFLAMAIRLSWKNDNAWLTAMPLAAGIADYCENVIAAYLAATFGKTKPVLEAATATATNIKFAFLCASLGLVLLGVIALILRKLKGEP